MSYERPYYSDIDYHPYLFYVVFDISDDKLEISRTRHHVESMPEGLDISICSRPQNSEYMDSLTGGTLGKLLRMKDPFLYDRACASERWAVIKGSIKNDSTLDYMRDAIGVIQAFVDTGAAGILDLQTLSLLSPEDWSTDIFAARFSPFMHTVILSSEEDDGTLWLHTRGMLKFGRPDISIRNVPAKDVNAAAELINQMIYYGSQGAFLNSSAEFTTQSGMTCVIEPEFVNDFENEDHNNAYYTMSWQDCELSE